MYFGNIIKCDIEDGIGVRVSLFVSGCRHHCKGCFQPETWDFNYGEEFTDKTEAELLEALKPDYIDGLTLLGGEPFEPENQKVLYPFLKKLREYFPNKNVWCYSGYTFEELCGNAHPVTDVTVPMLELIDVLVDGEFVQELKNISLQFRGSSNQRILDVKESLKNGTPQIYLD